MWCVLFLAFNLYLQVHGGRNNYNIVRFEVTKQYYAGVGFDLPNTGFVLNNKNPLHIIMDNYDASAKDVQCKNKDNKYEFKTTAESKTERGKHILIIKVDEITEDMSTLWECTTRKPSGYYQTFTFKIHIKGKETVDTSIGRLSLTYRPSDLTVQDYDGKGEYWFTEGEAVDMVCKSNQRCRTEGYIHLTYYDKNGVKLFETQNINAQYQASFRKTMRKDNNNDYVDCTCIISKTELRYTYRTTFRLKVGSGHFDNPIKITINGLKLVPAISSGKGQYQRRFYVGEMLNISCETDANTDGRLSLEFDYKLRDLELIPVPETVSWRVTNILKASRKLDDRTLSCTHKYKGTENVAEIFFVQDSIDPIIVGLPANGVIQEYSNDFATWVIDFGYYPGQTLNLTCVGSVEDRYQWCISNNSREIAVTERSGGVKTNSFVLDESYTGTSIICDIIKGKTYVHLLEKRNLQPDNIFEEDKRNDSPVDRPTDHTEGNQSNSPERTDNASKLSDEFFILVASVGASIVVVIAVCLTMWCRSRRKQCDLQAPYENLSNDPDSAIPTYPSQWADTTDNTNDGAMTDNSLYNMDRTPQYAFPQKKNKRPIEPLYHTIDPVYNVPYSEIGENENGNNYVNSVGKANFVHKKVQGVKDNAKLCNNELVYNVPYSEIGENENANNYVNSVGKANFAYTNVQAVKNNATLSNKELVYNVPYSEIGENENTNNYVNTVEKANFAQKNIQGVKGNSRLGNTDANYDYVTTSNASTAQYSDPMYCEIPSMR